MKKFPKETTSGLFIESEVLDEIMAIINEVLPENHKVYMFGSRATGRRLKHYSDVDLALDNDGDKMPRDVLTDLSVKSELSSLPYKVDIVDINAISDSFREMIKDDLVKLSM